MLVKMTARGPDFQSAVTRRSARLAEFRIRGLATNIPFLQAVLDDPDFVAGQPVDVVHRRASRVCWSRVSRRTAAPRSITWLADVTVNRRTDRTPGGDRSGTQAAGVDSTRRRRPGPGSGCSNWGRPGSPPRCVRSSGSRSPTRPSATLTSSLLATRVRTRDLLQVAPTSRA